MKATVCVTLKDGIHDPQGKAILQALLALGFDGVKGVRAGKYFELDLSGESVEMAEQSLHEMCEKLLANTVIEKYRYEINVGV
ncbi:MAG: phosphoribosylformylglycinamidine synthase subunit PurS [Nitrospirae bacterium]|nr:phosphoribosylformylglycinamidine synthase subunit PurS [Candidatus Troglogloeales bacterium]